jgi:N-acetylmuramoyl-L-alanine amidase
MKVLGSESRRQLLQAGSLVLLLGAHQLARGATVVAVRLWPAQDYTRVTIESDGALKVHTVASDATRLALDLEGIDLAPSLQELVGKLRSNDPNIAAIRVSPGSGALVRLTIDLKQAVRPQVFHLQPVAAYQHRLVLDLYPAQPIDPLEQLVAQRLKELDAASERAARLLGHETGLLESTPHPLNPMLPAQPAQPDVADPLGALIAQREQVRAPPAAPPQQTAQARPALPTPTPTGSTPRPAGDRAGVGATVSARPTPGAATERLIIVALDPGHGGEDPGAIGPGGTYEKDVVLQIALKLRERINATRVNGSPMRAYMTRDADFFVPLGTRVRKAQQVKADLFISIHADAFMTPQPAGASVYALSTRGATSASARWIANKENAADLVGGINVKAKDATVQRALLDMSTTAQIKDSLKLGSAMLGEVGRVGRLHKPRVEQAGFAVLKAPDIPSVLVETAFISNPDEERRLRDEAFQNRLADALMRGIVQYFSARPPLAKSRST